MHYFNPVSKGELLTIFDEKAIFILKHFIKRSQINQPEVIESENNLTFQVINEHVELWFSQALNLKRIGQGSSPIDLVSSNNEIGADIAVLHYKSNKNGISRAETGEKSIFQKFSDEKWSGLGSTLDDLFDKNENDKIAEAANNIFFDKLSSINHIADNYYFILMLPPSGLSKAFLIALKLNTENKLEPLVKKRLKESVVLDNFIDESYGSVKVYKAKKRVELRIKPKPFLDKHNYLEFEIDNNFKKVILRDLETYQINEYFDNLYKDIFRN